MLNPVMVVDTVQHQADKLKQLENVQAVMLAQTLEAVAAAQQDGVLLEMAVVEMVVQELL
jgi:hypothetical protein